jgi:hypothetical protein
MELQLLLASGAYDISSLKTSTVRVLDLQLKAKRPCTMQLKTPSQNRIFLTKHCIDYNHHIRAAYLSRQVERNFVQEHCRYSSWDHRPNAENAKKGCR